MKAFLACKVCQNQSIERIVKGLVFLQRLQAWEPPPWTAPPSWYMLAAFGIRWSSGSPIFLNLTDLTKSYASNVWYNRKHVVEMLRKLQSANFSADLLLLSKSVTAYFNYNFSTLPHILIYIILESTLNLDFSDANQIDKKHISALLLSAKL